jgi:uncharacterized membrane protein YjgN (DUF898 family)
MKQFQTEPDAQPERLRFHATGGEYFRIWIVNLLLTIVTLGIYSAWAKVRRNQYFYSSTQLAGSSFEYHGNPVAILKGRIVAAVVFAIYFFGAQVSPVLSLIALVVMAGAAPWFVWRSFQFRLYNSAYRGIRFRFVADVRDAYVNYLVRPWLNAVSAGLAAPFVHQRAKAWQVDESRFGQARFSFDAGVGDFYKLYGCFVLAGGAGIGLTIWLILSGAPLSPEAPGYAANRQMETGFVIMAIYAWLLLLAPLFINMVQNMVWNHTSLEQHRFQSDVKWGRMLFITVTNYLAVICTLGLFLPFARVRSMRYRIESLMLVPSGSLDDVLAGADGDVSATGEGMAEFMDFDFSL